MIRTTIALLCIGAAYAADAPGDKNPVSKGIDLARARKHWSFQPLREVSPPATIDSLLETKRQAAGLRAAPQADDQTLIRRMWFDVTGLPPGPADLAAKRPHAQVVDSLLTSPQFGERWGRHWLDLVRFAETDGHEFDNDKPNAWRYRDYVIRALNDDVPYDVFVKEHLAGDLLPEKRIVGGVDQSTIATGFYWLGENINTPVDSHAALADRIDNQIDVATKAFLGLTVACSRCHDHKFDPVPTADYYALAGFLHSSRPRQAAITGPERKAPAAANCAGYDWQFSGAAFECSDGRVTSGIRSGSETGYAISNVFPIAARYVHVLMAGASELRLVADEYRFPPGRKRGAPRMEWVTIDARMVEGRTAYFELADLECDTYLEIARVVISAEKTPPAMETTARPPKEMGHEIEAAFTLSTTDGSPTDVPIYVRGSYKTTGDVQSRRFLRIFSGDEQQRISQGSGRLELADRLLTDARPLVARVIVNRIWQHYFGQGIVATPDNFGLTGEPPANRDLLDWLAAELIRGKWSLKHIHRLILSSAAYRLSSVPPEGSEEKDPKNKLVTHMPVKRLEAEALRDAMMAVSGRLDKTMYGPSVPVYVSPFMDGDPRGKPVSGPIDSNGRRSLYINIRRNYMPDSLMAFDCPQPISTAGRRNVSIVPSQALYLMNNEFVHQMAERWAARPGIDPESMYLQAFGRPATNDELTDAREFLKGHSLADYAHVLLMTTEFQFVR